MAITTHFMFAFGRMEKIFVAFIQFMYSDSGFAIYLFSFSRDAQEKTSIQYQAQGYAFTHGSDSGE